VLSCSSIRTFHAKLQDDTLKISEIVNLGYWVRLFSLGIPNPDMGQPNRVTMNQVHESLETLCAFS